MSPAQENTPKIAGYETTFIARSELSDEGVRELQERLANVVKNYGGEIILTEDWGKKKLAYTIQKESRGHYIYTVYTGKGDIVHEMERNLRLHDHVLRFLTVNLEKEFDADKFRKQRSDASAAAKRREEEREARREERHAERRSHDHDHYDRGGYDRGGFDRGDDESSGPSATDSSDEE